MKRDLLSWLTSEFPKNYILKQPAAGAIILFLFSFLFTILYRPLGSHPGRFFGYEITMAVYTLTAALSAFLIIKLMNGFRAFTEEAGWTLMKELAGIALTLISMGLAVYLAGFAMEEPGSRLNIATLLNSVKNVALAGVLPFAFFILANFRQWFSESEIIPGNMPEKTLPASDQEIKITSQLKKEELRFYPDELVCASSEGNYVSFFLLRNNKIQKHLIRNSISSIEEQLSAVPWMFRTHRAFIVNLKKIRIKKGNSLGYRIKMIGMDEEIPVSRNHTRQFGELFRQFQ